MRVLRLWAMLSMDVVVRDLLRDVTVLAGVHQVRLSKSRLLQ